VSGSRDPCEGHDVETHDNGKAILARFSVIIVLMLGGSWNMADDAIRPMVAQSDSNVPLATLHRSVVSIVHGTFA